MRSRDNARDSAQGLSEFAARPAKPADVLGLGIAFAIAGLVFMLMASGALPALPGDGAPVMLFLTGAAFMFAGLTCAVKARSGIGGLRIEASAGKGPGMGFRVLAIAAVGTLATVGTFIAIASGSKGLLTPLIETSTAGEKIGRAVFALGVTVAWIYLIALSVNLVRRLHDRQG